MKMYRFQGHILQSILLPSSFAYSLTPSLAIEPETAPPLCYVDSEPCLSVMKFGSHLLEELQYPGWEDHYIRYKEIKKMIVHMKEERNRGSALQYDDDYYASTFGSYLIRDMNRAHSFIVRKCREMDAIRGAVIQAIEDIDHAVHVKLPRLEIGTPKRYREKQQEVEHEVSRSRSTSVDQRVSNSALQHFATYLEELQELRFFSSVNLEAARKIAKKFRKQLGISLSDDPMKDHPLVQSLQVLDVHCSDAENACRVMRMKCPMCDGHIKEIRGMLQNRSATDKKRRLQMENKKNISAPWRQSLYAQILDIHTIFHPSTVLKGALIVPMITLAITYTISSQIYITETQTIFDLKGYFISASIDEAPASCIGTLGLCLTLYCLSMVIFVKHKITSNKLRGHNTMFHRLSFYTAIISMVCGVGVASYQHHNARATHNVFAVSFFVWGVIHICMECFLELKCRLESNRKLTRLRTALAAITCFNIPIFVGGVYLGAIRTVRNGLPRNLYILNTAAAAELVMFFSFMFYFGSYYPTFKQCEVEIIVRTQNFTKRGNADLQGEVHTCARNRPLIVKNRDDETD